MSISIVEQESLIERAKRAYRARARRDLKENGIHWNQLPDSGWYAEQSPAGTFVACLHGGGDACRYRLVGDRLKVV